MGGIFIYNKLSIEIFDVGNEVVFNQKCVSNLSCKRRLVYFVINLDSRLMLNNSVR